MKGKKMRPMHAAAWTVLASLLYLTATACCSVGAATPRSVRPSPEIFDQEVVNIAVNYEKKAIAVRPESVRIYLQWNKDALDPLKPVQARWKVKGLRSDHVIYIVPKEEAPRVEFPYPTEFRGRPAFYIDGKNNSIVSGEVRSMPGLERGTGYTERRREGRYSEEDPYKVVWPYDVLVTDGNGKVLFEVDPDIVITGHPPCC